MYDVRCSLNNSVIPRNEAVHHAARHCELQHVEMRPVSERSNPASRRKQPIFYREGAYIVARKQTGKKHFARWLDCFALLTTAVSHAGARNDVLRFCTASFLGVTEVVRRFALALWQSANSRRFHVILHKTSIFTAQKVSS
jgi:hypothetical protein